MSRADMFAPRDREDWMTQEFEDKLRKVAPDGSISCAQAQGFATEEKIAMNKMKAFLDVLEIKVKNCQLGCF
jgi:hypothetical protein